MRIASVHTWLRARTHAGHVRGLAYLHPHVSRVCSLYPCSGCLAQQTAPDAVLEELSQRFSEYTVTANPGYGRVFLTKSLAGGEDVQVEIDVQNTVEVSRSSRVAVGGCLGTQPRSLRL